MKPIIESLFHSRKPEIVGVYLQLLNAIVCAHDEAALRRGIEKLKTETPLDEYFECGFGSRHFWVHQRYYADRTKCLTSRLVKVEF